MKKDPPATPKSHSASEKETQTHAPRAPRRGSILHTLTNGKIPYSRLLEAAGIALLPTALAWFQYTFPYTIINPPIQILMFAAGSFIPSMIELILYYRLNVHLSENGFYLLMYAYHFAVWSTILYFYHKSQNKRKTLLKIGGVLLAYFAASQYLLG